jgi:serine/threonine-protein kinase RsbW
MIVNGTEQTRDQLALRSRLSDMVELPVWIEELASRYAIPASMQFAMNLCLEEVISNIIRHGYGSETDRPVNVRFTAPGEGNFVFIVDDEAPPFNPVEAPESPMLNPHDEIRIGGQGIRLLHRFADALEYEPTPTGNRLSIGFSVAGYGAPRE